MKHFIKPYPHQLEILELSRKERNLALLWEMGTGKTGATINILRDKYNRHKTLLRTLIISPQVTLYNWKNEFKVWSNIPEDRIIVLTGTGKKRFNMLSKAVETDNIIITNWEALINDTIFELLMAYGPRIVVGDELHYVKSHKSKRSKRACAITQRTRELDGHCIGLTGTPILNSPEDIFMQYKFLDGGEIFGGNFFAFRRRYMVDKNAGWNAPNSFSKWVPNEHLFGELNEKINSIATRIIKKECLRDLPPLIKTKRIVDLGTRQAKAYKEMKTDFITFVNSEACTASVAVTKALRLMEITSGYIKDEDGKAHVFEKNPRMDALKELLEELTPNHKVIVWIHWKENAKMIAKLCDKLKIKSVTVTGATSATEKAECIDSFQSDEDVRVLIGNRRACGIGVNLTAAAYSIVYSRNFSLGDENQSEARNYRSGSQIHEQIVKVDLIAKETIDEQVLDALENKQNISDCLIDWSQNGKL